MRDWWTRWRDTVTNVGAGLACAAQALLPPPWWAASILSNGAIMYVEYINRHTPGGFVAALPKTFVPIMLAQWCLYICFNGAPNWYSAWAVFALGNSAMRLVAVSTLAGGEVGNWWLTGAGIATMIGGSLLLKMGLK